MQPYKVVIVPVKGNRHGDPSSNLRRTCLHFTYCQYPREKNEYIIFQDMGK